MPWKENKVGEARGEFVQAVLKRRESFAAVCREHGISRACGHKWWRRFEAEGRAGLVERPRRPQVAGALRQRWQAGVLAARRAHPRWGADKLHSWLAREHGSGELPSVRTMGRWLKAAGQSGQRARRAPDGPRLQAPAAPPARQPNDVWTIDFKGSFRTADGRRIFALTVRDAASRQVLAVRHLPRPGEAAVRRELQRLFRRYGLPRAVLVDNGAPFGSAGPLGLTALSVWWLRLGVRVVFTRPGCPQDNGAHEQMHRILKADTARPAATNAAAQQRRFDRWRRHYNHERPHQALGQQPPAAHYRPSPRPAPRTLPEWQYPAHWQRLRIGANGRAFWGQRPRMFGRAFAGEWLGLRTLRNGWTEVYLGRRLLGLLHPLDRAGLRPARLRHSRSRRGKGGG